MTEFGKSKLLSAATLEQLGVNVVIYPVTTLRIAMGAVESGLRTLAAEGTQESLVPAMQTRGRLYELVDYASYAQFDSAVHDFTLTAAQGGRDARGARDAQDGTAGEEER